MFKKTYEGVRGLLSGMALTLHYLVRFDKVITQQYPENRSTLKLPKRTRSRIELIKSTEEGKYNCSACGLCVRACPNGSIEVERSKDPVTKKNKLDRFVYHFERCTVCGLCVESCHSDGLQMSQHFETAVYDSSQLTVILNEGARSEAPATAPAAPVTPAAAPDKPATPEPPK